MVLTRQRNRCVIHDVQVFGQHLVEGQMIVAHGVGILGGIGIVDAVDLGALEQRIAVHFRGPQGRRRIGGEERVARSSGEDHNPALFKVTQRPLANEGLTDVVHRDGRHHPALGANILQRGPHGQRVDDCGQHAHLVSRRPLHPLGGAGNPAEDVAATNHQTDLRSQLHHTFDLVCDARDISRVEPVTAIAHQGFTRNLQQNATKDLRITIRHSCTCMLQS